jgi:hypothetical protein
MSLHLVKKDMDVNEHERALHLDMIDFKEASVAHDEWSIGDLLHWLSYPSLPITFPCFESCGV